MLPLLAYTSPDEVFATAPWLLAVLYPAALPPLVVFIVPALPYWPEREAAVAPWPF